METLKVYQKWEDMATYLYGAIRQYPKSERHTLAAETARSSIEVGTAIARANAAPASGAKRRFIEQADTELARLKILVRLGMKLEFLPMKRYEILSGQLTEIGKMIGGWLKSAA
jgi:four helix bundle protein